MSLPRLVRLLGKRLAADLGVRRPLSVHGTKPALGLQRREGVVGVGTALMSATVPYSLDRSSQGRLAMAAHSSLGEIGRQGLECSNNRWHEQMQAKDLHHFKY